MYVDYINVQMSNNEIIIYIGKLDETQLENQKLRKRSTNLKSETDVLEQQLKKGKMETTVFEQ